MALSAVAPACAPLDPHSTAAELAEAIRLDYLAPTAAADLRLPDGWEWVMEEGARCPDLTPTARVALEAAQRQLWALRAAHAAMRAAGEALARELEAMPAPRPC